MKTNNDLKIIYENDKLTHVKPISIEFSIPKKVKLVYNENIVKYISEENINQVTNISFSENPEDKRIYVNITFGNTGIVCTIPINNLEELIIHD